jgi:hypothetical protein
MSLRFKGKKNVNIIYSIEENEINFNENKIFTFQITKEIKEIYLHLDIIFLDYLDFEKKDNEIYFILYQQNEIIKKIKYNENNKLNNLLFNETNFKKGLKYDFKILKNDNKNINNITSLYLFNINKINEKLDINDIVKIFNNIKKIK